MCSVESKLWSVKCGVYRANGEVSEVWSVKCGVVSSVEREVK